MYQDSGFVNRSFSNQTALVNRRRLKFVEEQVPVTVWSYQTTTTHPFMNRALSASVEITDADQCAFVIFSYTAPEDFYYAGIVNDVWSMGHCSELQPPCAVSNSLSTIRPKINEPYRISVEVRRHELTFTAFKADGAEAVRFSKLVSVSKEGASGTACLGHKTNLPQLSNFGLNRLFRKTSEQKEGKIASSDRSTGQFGGQDAIPE